MNIDKKNTFNTFIQTALNKPQQEAVLQKNGALLVTAGAGSGKTRVITARIAHLILNEDISPSSIVAMTFTNKAAGEMKERLISFLGTHHNLPFIGTFHAFCLQQLRSHPYLLPFEHFSILDSDDQQTLLKKIIKKNNLAKYVSSSQVAHQISQHKNKQALCLQDDFFNFPYLKDVYTEYEQEKAQAHSFDFDDLLINVVSLFQKNTTFKENFQANVRHVLVDEYQDTNHIQHLLLKLIALNKENQFCIDSVCAVGDEDQSIYSWRGATVANMLKFSSDFAPVTHVKIEQNYRSVQPILEIANNVIEHNSLRNPKKLWSERAASNRAVHLTCRSAEQEAESVTQCIKALQSLNNNKTIAILYRTHYQSRVLEEALLYHSIPYKIVGGIRFYERKEIKDILAYLKLIINPFDKLSLLRIINCPARGLGQKFEDDLQSRWNQEPFADCKGILTMLLNDTHNPLTKAKQNAVETFLQTFEALDKESSPTEAIDAIIERVEYISYLKAEYDTKEADEKIENIREFRSSATIFESDCTANQKKATLEQFLHDIALLQEKIEKQEPEEHIPLMTLHAAKGLEFDTVIITGLEENILPSSKSLVGNEELEEERRLFYVGITRAKEYLLVTSAGYRNTFGQIVDQIPSRFLQEIPQKLIVKKNIESYNTLQIKSFFDQWLGNPSAASRFMTFNAAHTMPKPSPQPTKIPASKPQSGWQKNQRVMHTTFGMGIIVNVEKADNDEYHITALFKIGKKTLLSSFLKRIS